MENSNDPVNIRLCRLYGQLWRQGTINLTNDLSSKRLTRELLLDTLTTIYDECNKESLKKNPYIANFIEKYRLLIYELKHTRVNISDFEIKNIIGQGYFGDVHVVREKQTGDIYAMKTLQKDKTLTCMNITYFEEERDIMALSNSVWIIKLQYAFQDTSQLYLIMEYCPGGDLAALLDKTGKPFLEKDAVFYLAEICQAIKDVHALGFIHRDIKPDNILFDRCGHIKLGDFGSAARLSNSGKVKATLPIGTTEYISPEILLGLENPNCVTLHGVMKPCDYWSIGIVAYELVTYCTPFKSENNDIKEVYRNIINYANKSQPQTIKYPTEINISDKYKKFVQKLLHSIPEKRPVSSDISLFKIFENLVWETLREQVPPFVPIITSLEDTSNFLEIKEKKHSLPIQNFRTKSDFEAKNFPFIGFTYIHDLGNNFDCNINLHTNTTRKNSGCNGLSESTSSSEFSSNNLNGTVICLSNMREKENLLELRKKEIEQLHKKIAQLTATQLVNNEKDKKLLDIEAQRSQLEKHIAEVICQNNKLQNQLEIEHKGQEILEQKSLQLICSAKDRWRKKTELHVSSLNKSINEYKIKETESTNKILELNNDLENTKLELNKTIEELETFKKIKMTHKETMAKARRLSRQSIIGIEQISQESNIQIQTLTQNLKKEIELKNKINLELQETINTLKLAEEREINLIETLRKDKESYTKELILITDKYEDKCFELTETLSKYNDLREKNTTLAENEIMIINKEKNISTELNISLMKITTFEREIEKLKISNDKYKRLFEEKTELCEKLLIEKSNINIDLQKAIICEEKHKERVAALEDTLMKLQNEVALLEKLNQETSLKSSSDLNLANTKNDNVEQEIQKLQEELKKFMEDNADIKREARKTNLALWKKEKELANAELDCRILTKDLKKAEEKITYLSNDLEKKTKEYDEKINEIHSSLDSKIKHVKNLEKEITILQATINSNKIQIRTMEEDIISKTNIHALNEQKMTMEIKSLNDKIEKFTSDIKTFEREKCKLEDNIKNINNELKITQVEKNNDKEQRIRLEVTLHERNKEYDSITKNYKMLQETCTILEEQLIDFENVTENLDTTNAKLKEETITLKSEMQNLKLELSKLQKNVDIQKLNILSNEIKNKEYKQMYEDEQNKNSELKMELNNILACESSRSTEINEKKLEISQLCSKMIQNENNIHNQHIQINSLKEECTHLLTDYARLREENLNLNQQLIEYKENISSLNNFIKEQNEELSARSFHWQQQQLKAEATIAQQIKLIDFLQIKIDEVSKKKKTFGDIFFGKSSNKENVLPSTPQTPMHPRTLSLPNQTKEIIHERQKNCELTEEIYKLKNMLKKLGIQYDEKCNTVTQNEKAISQMENLIQGWVKIQRGAVLSRVFLKLNENCISWKGEKAEVHGQLQFNKDTTRFIADLSPTDYDIHLSESEKNCAFKIISSSNTTCWPAQSLLVVCTTVNQKENWVSNISTVMKQDDQISLIPHEKPKLVLKFFKEVMEPNCLVELEKNLILIGSNNGLYCSSLNGPKNILVTFSKTNDILKIRCAANINQIIILFNTGRLVHYSLCQLKALVKSTALSSIQPSNSINFIKIHVKDSKDTNEEDGHCNMFEVSQFKNSTSQTLLAASTSTKLVIYKYDKLKMNFIPLKMLQTDSITCMKFTQHTLIVASHKFYEIELKNFKVEEFLDPSDPSLSNIVFAHKNNIFPIAIVQTKDAAVDKCYEYLLCYSSFGVFVDEYGQRSRSEDIKWSHLPIQVVYRKPFIFISHLSSIQIIYLKDDSYKKISNSDYDNASLNSKTLCNIPETVMLNFNSVRYLGKSSKTGTILFMTVMQKSDDMLEILELNGNLLFKKILGDSIETLDTIDDIDSCKNLKESHDSLSLPESEISSEDSSANIKTDFAAHIRERAKVLQNLKHENKKIDLINNIISKKNKKDLQSDSSDDESDTSSIHENNKSQTLESDDTYINMTKNENPVAINDTPKRTSDIVKEMFLSKKQVRFN